MAEMGEAGNVEVTGLDIQGIQTDIHLTGNLPQWSTFDGPDSRYCVPILCLSVCCYDMIGGFHAQKGAIIGPLVP